MCVSGDRTYLHSSSPSGSRFRRSRSQSVTMRLEIVWLSARPSPTFTALSWIVDYGARWRRSDAIHPGLPDSRGRRSRRWLRPSSGAPWGIAQSHGQRDPASRHCVGGDTALWLYVLARQVQHRGEPAQISLGRRRIVASPIGLLAAIPSIDVDHAKSLMSEFGSIAAIAVASEHELQSIAGIGPRRARAVLDALAPTTPSSRLPTPPEQNVERPINASSASAEKLLPGSPSRWLLPPPRQNVERPI